MVVLNTVAEARARSAGANIIYFKTKHDSILDICLVMIPWVKILNTIDCRFHVMIVFVQLKIHPHPRMPLVFVKAQENLLNHLIWRYKQASGMSALFDNINVLKTLLGQKCN